jgi:hypothetical protein
MGKGEERETKHVFEGPATLREPAAPRIPRVMPPSAVSVIPLSEEGRALATEPPPTTLQEAREATDALLHEILEEDEPEAPQAPARRTPGQPSQEEDWPAELHSIHLPEL